MGKTRSKKLGPLPSIQRIAEAIDWPTDIWPGNCYAVASAAVQAGLFPDGHVRYGHYHGPVAPTSSFAHHRFPRHGWILLDDGTIVDLTRWVFEDIAPYVAVIPRIDARQEEYEMGGASIERKVHGWPPAPGPDECFGNDKAPRPCPLRIHPRHKGAIAFIWNLFQREPRDLTMAQVYWLAHLTPDEFGTGDARPIYEAIEGARQRVLIPIDYWHAVMEDPLECPAS